MPGACGNEGHAGGRGGFRQGFEGGVTRFFRLSLSNTGQSNTMVKLDDH